MREATVALLLVVPLLAVAVVLALTLSPGAGTATGLMAGCTPATIPSSGPVRPGRPFDAIAELEAYLCHRVPYPRDTGGMRGPRIVGAPAVADGRVATGNLIYFDAGRSLIVEFSRGELSRPPGGPPAETVTIGGESATFIPVPDPFVAAWTRGGLHFIALGDGMSREEFLRMLESIE